MANCENSEVKTKYQNMLLLINISMECSEQYINTVDQRALSQHTSFPSKIIALM